MPEETQEQTQEQQISLDSSEAQALEGQIQKQQLDAKIALQYFQSVNLAFTHKNYATSTQIRKLARKHRRAVKGINPWAAEDRNYFSFETEKTEPLLIPDFTVCEFCGKQLDYLGALEKGRIYEWEVTRWSAIPMICDCEEAKAKHDAEVAEKERIRQEEEQRKREEERKKRVERQLANSGMKARFLTRTFANFQKDTAGRKQAWNTAKEYADNFQAHKANGDGLYIEGTFGTGKTHIAAAIAIQLMEQGHQVIFQTADDLLRGIKVTFDETGSKEQEAIDRLKNCELLVIDDIGKEQATDWSTAQLYAIINDRYESQKPLIITTNFNETDLIAVESPKGVGAHRIMAILSRLHETCSLMTMSWQDWRGA